MSKRSLIKIPYQLLFIAFMSSRIRPNTYDVYTFITLYQDRVYSFTVMQFPNLDTILQLNTSTQYQQ